MSKSLELWFQNRKNILKDFFIPINEWGNIFSNTWVSFTLLFVVFLCILIVCILRYGKEFRKVFHKPQTLAITALLISVNIVLGYHTIRISDSLRIGFGFVTQPIVAMFFGPLVCCITGMMQDVISLFLQGTGAYIPAYTLSVGISGMFYGMFLYQKKPTIIRIILTEFLVIFIGNILLNSIALAPTVGSGFIGILPARIIKNVLFFPIQSIVVYFILSFMKKNKFTQKFGR